MTVRGVYVAALTPFTEKGELDLLVLQTHLAFLVSEKVHGLVPCGTTGESPTIKPAERTAIVKACIELTRGTSVQTMVGCGGNDTASVADLIQEAEGLGASSTLVVTPYYNRPTQSGLIAHYVALADKAHKPLFLYHVPGRTQVAFTLDTVRALFQHPKIAGIKEASGQYSFWTALAEVARENHKTVLAGDDDAFAVIQSLGGKGIISACANLVPGAFVRLFEAMENGRWTEVFKLQQALIPLVRALFAETSPAPLKYAFSKRGKMANSLRLPLVPVSASTQTLIENALSAFEESRP
jgi:4-hydroxy-tetrahydrodipicolinate synthase